MNNRTNARLAKLEANALPQGDRGIIVVFGDDPVPPNPTGREVLRVVWVDPKPDGALGASQWGGSARSGASSTTFNARQREHFPQRHAIDE
jgi:hypothetical protein